MITTILLLLYLVIGLIARIIPFSGCLHYLEASQLINDANLLTGFPVMGISVARHLLPQSVR